jgi:hypothetical protein
MIALFANSSDCDGHRVLVQICDCRESAVYYANNFNFGYSHFTMREPTPLERQYYFACGNQLYKR